MSWPSFELVPWLNDAKGVRYDLANSSAPSARLDVDLNQVPRGYANTWGFPRLRALVAETYGVREDEVVLTAGTQEAAFLSLLALGVRKVAAEIPSYPPVFGLPQVMGLELVPLARTWDAGFAVELDAVECAFKAGAQALVLTNPHNPGGVSVRAPVLKGVCELAERHGAYVVVDEIYRELMERPAPLARHISDRAITVAGVSKAYGLGGARVGWALTTRELAERMRLAKDYVSVSNSTHGETLAIAALENSGRLLAASRAHVARNLAHAKRFMEGQRLLAWAEPEANMAFPRLPPGVGSVEFCRKALKEGLLLAPGKYFGLEGHFRMTFCCPEEEMRQGLEVLGGLL